MCVDSGSSPRKGVEVRVLFSALVFTRSKVRYSALYSECSIRNWRVCIELPRATLNLVFKAEVNSVVGCAQFCKLA